MKKKIIFAIATGFFAVTTVFNMNMLQSNNAGDVSLDAIAVMAQAQNELPEVTVYGCSVYAEYYDEEEQTLTKCCHYYTSTTPCVQEC